MTLTSEVEIKYGVYTLCCRKILEHFVALSEASDADTRWTVDDCISRVFNSSLKDFSDEAKPSTLREGVKSLNGLIRSRTDLKRSLNPGVAEVLERIACTMEESADSWSREDDIQIFHRLGQDLARRFYEGSPWPKTRELLQREVQVVYDHWLPAPDGNLPLGTEIFSHLPAPFASRLSYEDEGGETQECAILIRYSFDQGFSHYLAYPFLFLHEYTAHIYATDYGNDKFNDGWMLHAADVFLKHRWRESDFKLMLRQQANIFYDHLYIDLKKRNSASWLACQFVRDFESWLSGWAPGRFKAITHELAAYAPLSGEGEYLPTQFINALRKEFDTNRTRLRKKIESVPDIRTLLSLL